MKLLLATDGSEYSDGAARFLARFDLSQTDEIMVLHVIPGVPFPHSGGPYNAALMQLGEELAPRIIDATTGLMKGLRANVSTVVTTGHPAEAIIDVAAQSDSDMIVMGNRGMKAIGSLLLGSVTRAVAINSRAIRSGRQTAPGETGRPAQGALCHRRLGLRQGNGAGPFPDTLSSRHERHGCVRLALDVYGHSRPVLSGTGRTVKEDHGRDEGSGNETCGKSAGSGPNTAEGQIPERGCADQKWRPVGTDTPGSAGNPGGRYCSRKQGDARRQRHARERGPERPLATRTARF